MAGATALINLSNVLQLKRRKGDRRKDLAVVWVAARWVVLSDREVGWFG